MRIDNSSVRFNPRPRAGGDLVILHSAASAPIFMFQSAPPRGGRLGSDSMHGHDPLKRFNPRPRTGGDPAAAARSDRDESGFNPRPRTGGDVASSPCSQAWIEIPFQSAPPHGGRPRWSTCASIRHCPGFNPRPRTGGDAFIGQRCNQRGYCEKFQSAPPHGGRPSRDAWRTAAGQHVSIRAPARGATHGSRVLPALS